MANASSNSPQSLEQAIAASAVAHNAPQLQGILNEALKDGGWFGDAHQQALDEALSAADPAERERLVRKLLAEETRVGMLVGVAVGLELASELTGESALGDAVEREEQ